MWAVWTIGTIILLFGFVVFWGAPYVPSKKSDLKRAFDELYPLGKRDVLIDIGSGDGVVLRQAAQRGAAAVGYELNPLLVWISRWLSRHEQGITVQTANFWHVKLPHDTTVVYTFAVSRDGAKLARKLTDEATRLGRPLLLISYGHSIPNYAPIKTVGAHLLYRFEPLQAVKAQV